MLKSPALYGVGADYQEDDSGLIQKRADSIHSAAVLLEKCQLLKYERTTGRFQSTDGEDCVALLCDIQLYDLCVLSSPQSALR